MHAPAYWPPVDGVQASEKRASEMVLWKVIIEAMFIGTVAPDSAEFVGMGVGIDIVIVATELEETSQER